MELRINGKPYDVPAIVNTMEELAECMKLRPDCTFIKLNHEHIPWDKWSSTFLKAEDVIEALVFVGGG